MSRTMPSLLVVLLLLLAVCGGAEGTTGAGKSTLLSIIGRLLPADDGRVPVDGHPVALHFAGTRTASSARSEVA